MALELYLYIFIHTYTHSHTHTHTYIHTYLHTNIHKYIHTVWSPGEFTVFVWCQTWHWRRCYFISAVLYREKVIYCQNRRNTQLYVHDVDEGIDANFKPDGTCGNHFALKGLICVNNYIKRVTLIPRKFWCFVFEIIKRSTESPLVGSVNIVTELEAGRLRFSFRQQQVYVSLLR